MRKKIVIDGVIFGLQKAGGITRTWVALLKALDETFARTHKIYLLLPKNNNIDFQSLSLSHIKVIHRRRFRWKKSSFFDSLYLTFIALFLRPNLWYTTYYVGFPFLFSGKKWVTLHDMISEFFPSDPYETQRKLSTLTQSDHIVAISESTGRDLKRLWPTLSSKTEIVLHGYTPKEKKIAFAPEPTLLFMGKRGGYKNFISIARQILKDPRFHSYSLLSVGGEERLSSEELQLRAEVGDEKLQFLGLLPFDRVQELLASSTLLLFPSLYEGFGFPVLEAFSLGVPVLSFRTSSIPEIVGEPYPLIDLAHPEEANEIALALIQERKRWSNYAIERAELFTFDKKFSQFSSLLKKNYAILPRHHNL